MRVILSADDFARSHQRNLAIDNAMRNGLIKSAALMVNSEYTDEAIRLAIWGGILKTSTVI